MSGFDAAFSYRPDDEALVRALFAAGRRRARRLHVGWRSEINPGYAYVAMDAAGFDIDMLLERLRRELPSVAEGVNSASRTPDQRRDILGRFRMSLYDRYYREKGDHLPRLRGLRRQAIGSAIACRVPESGHGL
jgi:hypothetical protein